MHYGLCFQSRDSVWLRSEKEPYAGLGVLGSQLTYDPHPVSPVVDGEAPGFGGVCRFLRDLRKIEWTKISFNAKKGI